MGVLKFNRVEEFESNGWNETGRQHIRLDPKVQQIHLFKFKRI